METYDKVKRAIQQSFMDNGSTVSHHHGVGEEHSPWLDQDIAGRRLHPAQALRRRRSRP